uniref:Secreted protein n=1 Tax=Eutreptiella gymnastica TaxID=73025 RepID=A0A7S4D0E2_9EUGL
MNMCAIFAPAATLLLMLPADTCHRETVFIAGKQPLRCLCSRYLIFQHDKLSVFFTSFKPLRNHHNEGRGAGKTGQILRILTRPIAMSQATIPTVGCSLPELGYIVLVCMNLIARFTVVALPSLKFHAQRRMVSAQIVVVVLLQSGGLKNRT